MEPTQKPGRSKQDYATPREFIRAVEHRFGTLTFDLAASAENSVVPGSFYCEADDALKQNWNELSGLGWLNPPFGDIGPWAQRCAAYAHPGFRLLMLTPASVGSNWFAQHVHGKAIVLGLAPRLSFDGKNAYPKDLMLSCFGFGAAGFDVWRWTQGDGRELMAVG